MVHALEKVRGLLKHGGVVINVHDLACPPCLEVHTGKHYSSAGWLSSRNDFEKVRHADKALAQVAANGLFTTEYEHVFEYHVRADSFTALREWLGAQWETSYPPDEAEKLVEELLSSGGEDTKVVLRRFARMTRLEPTTYTSLTPT